MRRSGLNRVVASALPVVVVALCLFTFPSAAQSYTVLHLFAASQTIPSRLLQATDGNFYGTTNQSGTYGYGTVFRITSGGALTTLYSFSGGDGSNPQGGLVQGTDGNFYGTTYQGGAYGAGTVFRITPAGVLTTLYAFSGSDGSDPQAALVQGTDGTFYGSTYWGGFYGFGTVFRITPVGVLTTLYSFSRSGGSDGNNPYAALVQGNDGSFYGTTNQGGSYGYGTVFRITTAGALTTLHSFNWTDGIDPRGGLVQGTDGNFYGTTSGGGPLDNLGTIFRITPAGVLETVHAFYLKFLTAGATPCGGLVQGTDGNFFGTASGGGTYGHGTVFRMTPWGSLTNLYSFSGNDGSNPQAALVQGTDGNFYGTTNQGGAYGYGTVFGITPAGAWGDPPTLTTLYSFSGNEGSNPHAALVQGTDGNFYGTTSNGGTHDFGTVFRITPAGVLTTLYSFSGGDGSDPQAALVQGTDGNFYGTTYRGGAYGVGTVFRITPAGALTTLHSFSGSDGSLPQAALVQGSDENFYGTTAIGGTYDFGTVFRITPAGVLTTLHSFTNRSSPQAALVEGTDGNFYGTTYLDGEYGYGSVIRITPSGEMTPLYHFSGGDGSNPQAALVQGTDGNFFGTTNGGGTYGAGTVFRITLSGVLTTLYSFSGGVTSSQGGLVQGTDGDFYGTTNQGGTYGYGTIFRITPAGVLTTLYSFSGSGGQDLHPAALVQGTDGNFYGTTSLGGPSGAGVVFRLTLGLGPSPTVSGVSPTSGPVSGGTVVTVSGAGFQPFATVSFGGTAADAVTYYSTTTILARTRIHAAGAVAVTVTNPDSQPGSMMSAYTYTCSGTPTASNAGPFCVGNTISLSTPDAVLGATYSWTGPNGFTSSQQNPTILADTTAWTGSYNVRVTVAGCTSAPGTTMVVVNPTPAAMVVAAPSIIGAGSPNRTASVPYNAGSTFLWAIGNGTITAGQGTSQITFTGGAAGAPLTLSVTETNASSCARAPGFATVAVAPRGSAVPFYTLPPCRILDTRYSIGPLGGPALQPNATRSFDVSTSACGVPADAVAISANLTATNVEAQGELVVFPADILSPDTGTISFRAGCTRANNAIVSLSNTSATFSVFNSSTGTADLILDVNGYFR